MVTIALSHLLPHTLWGIYLMSPVAPLQAGWHTQEGLHNSSGRVALWQGAPLLQLVVKHQQPLGLWRAAAPVLFLIEQGCIICQSFCNPLCCCLCYRLCLKALPPALAEEFWFYFTVLSKDSGLLNFFVFQSAPGFLSSFSQQPDLTGIFLYSS